MIKAKYYLLPAIVCFIAIIAIGYYSLFTPFSNEDKPFNMYIDRDDTVDSITLRLSPVTSHLSSLTILMRHFSYEPNKHTGYYVIEPGQTTLDVMRMLKSGNQTPVMLTIPEVRTMDQLAARLSAKLMIDSAEIAPLLVGDSIPCLFIPDTYEVYWNISAKGFMDRMKREHDKFWNAERRRQAEAKGLTPDEVCTLASIIDEETANNAEKPNIAGMYLNRLRKGMLLQADPTVKFALKDFTLKRIYNSHLEVDSPYNTYKNTGLPPGPIKIASQQGIEAVLHAADHDYLYMCAKADFSGTHDFARTYKEHLNNAARYAAALNARGIK